MKILAIGDMHRKWQDMSELLFFAEKKGYDKVVFCGDYADDWFGDAEDTAMCWNEIMTAPDNVIGLMGNHDFVYAYATEMKMLYGSNKVQSGFDSATLSSMLWGSLGVKIRENDLIKAFPMSVEIDGVLYSHAGFSSRWIAEKKLRRYTVFDSKNLAQVDQMFKCSYSPLWQRPTGTYLGMAKMSKEQKLIAEMMLGKSPYPSDMKQVFGHTPVSTCTDLHGDGKVWCIDTFSTHPSGDNIGDRSVLEIVDGEKFRVVSESEWHK